MQGSDQAEGDTHSGHLATLTAGSESDLDERRSSDSAGDEHRGPQNHRGNMRGRRRRRRRRHQEAEGAEELDAGHDPGGAGGGDGRQDQQGSFIPSRA